MSIVKRKSDILPMEQLQQVAGELPRFLHFKKWNLAYSFEQNGISYRTLNR